MQMAISVLQPAMLHACLLNEIRLLREAKKTTITTKKMNSEMRHHNFRLVSTKVTRLTRKRYFESQKERALQTPTALS